VKKTFDRQFFEDKDIYGCVRTSVESDAFLQGRTDPTKIAKVKCYVCEEEVLIDVEQLAEVKVMRKTKEVLTMCFVCIADLEAQAHVDFHVPTKEEIKKSFDHLGYTYTEESLDRLMLKLQTMQDGKMKMSDLVKQ
jgi:Ser-tRNA(Ala) deacylase AlaX